MNLLVPLLRVAIIPFDKKIILRKLHYMSEVLMMMPGLHY
jgi:hypothetical protein